MDFNATQNDKKVSAFCPFFRNKDSSFVIKDIKTKNSKELMMNLCKEPLALTVGLTENDPKTAADEDQHKKHNGPYLTWSWVNVRNLYSHISNQT